jgi:Flp pilus assembly protein TadG
MTRRISDEVEVMNLFPRQRSGREQHGQTLVATALLLTVFLLFAGLAIDFGFTYLTRARLTKAMDAACLNAARSYSPTDPTVAQGVAKSAFSANYGSSSRDTAAPVPTVTPVPDPNNQANTLLNCSATVASNTFFSRILPGWATLSATANAQARHATLVMTLVLDRSGSMSSDGGWAAATNAIPKFVGYFDNVNDYVGLVSFESYSTIDVPITTTPGNFKTPIQTALNGLRPNGATFAQGGLLNGLTENNIPNPPGNVFKVIVFLTDGYANVINDSSLGCTGYNSINYGGHDSGDNNVSFFNPANGTNAICTIRDNASPTCVPCAATTFPSQYLGMSLPFTEQYVSLDAVFRTTNLATSLRTDPNPTTIYTIGLGNNVNTGFLQQMANDPSTAIFNPNQPAGLALLVPSCTATSTACNDGVLQAFQNIAANILLRLTQ